MMHLLHIVSITRVPAMSKRIILITGANKGIGLETARQLAREGHHVILAARDADKAAAATWLLAGEGFTVEPLALDVTDAASIARAAAQVEQRHGKLDTLVNNAGVALEPWGTAASQTSLDQWRRTYEANLFGVAAVTQAFLPLVRKSAAGRIVNLSSILGSLTLHADPKSPIYDMKSVAYDSSKSALNQYTVHLAHELRDTPIKVNSAHPGWVKTDLGGEQAPMELPEGAKTSVWLATLPDDGPTGGYFHMQDRLPW
jgi:NAD(P)-dependent dehydrogenase (short-subunit alcohol dehydrogenase family)